ncbi:MAG: pentapeptide repeat-containing protein [Microcoleaceae cyanobacterium]
MTSPSLGRDANPSQPPEWQFQVRQLPVWLRRCGAWAVEISLVAVSGMVPLTLGAISNRSPQSVPLNPSLRITSNVVAATLGLPVRERSPQVTALTNFFWSGALFVPILVSGWQVYLLSRTGQTLPKRWFGVQVVNRYRVPPSLLQALYRESIGRWGIPLGMAYGIWRLTGAFPNLVILTGLSGLMILADGLFAKRFKGRAGHDLLAGTMVREAGLKFNANPFTSYDWMGETEAVRSLVFTPRQRNFPVDLWAWMRQHPGITLITVSGLSMATVLGTFAGTQVYIQSQANRREFKHQDNELFLNLVGKLSPNTAKDTAQRQGAILALGTLNDSRAIPLLVDFLGQETNPGLLDVTQQALVSAGPDTLPYLRQLNQALKNELASMEFGANAQEKQLTAKRQQAVQRAIAKLLTIHSGSLHEVDLSRVDLSQPLESAQFTLVLNNTDLSGLNFRSSLLNQANLADSNFYSAGKDGRFGTFDDWIADLSGADLTDADLTGAFLSHVELKRTNLLRGILNKANLSAADLTEANLSSTKLIGANLEEAQLAGTKLTGADLTNAQFSNANLAAARMMKVKAQGAEFLNTNLQQAGLQDADLAGADFQGADLRGADLSFTQLTGANFKNANLQEATLQNADLSLVNLTGASLKNTDFNGAKFVATPAAEAKDGFIQSTETQNQSSRLKRVNFSQAKNLTPNQITYICNQGGIHPDCPRK